MKKLLLLLALVGMVAYGCTDSPTDDDNNPPTEQPGQGGPSGDEDLTFTNNTNTAPTISHEGGTAKISFTAALSWSVSVYADWLSVSEDEGEAGNGSFVITAEANTTAKERKGVVAIKLSNNKSYEITVKQSFNADSDDIEFINNTNTAPHMEFGGGTVQIAFLAKTDWTVTCYADWLSTSKSSGSAGENSFFITAASNPKEEERSGVVAIKSKNNKSYEIKVTQDPNAGIMQLTVAANEVLYTTVFDTQIKLYNESGFGGNLISHSYDVEKGYGSIRFDNYVTSIPSKAFKDCTTLESIYLPEGVTYIAPDAFEGCTNLKYIISPNSTNYSMFIYNGELMAIAPGLTDVTIPKEVTGIRSAVFQNSKVENLTLYANTSIEDNAFKNNYTLKTVTIIDSDKGSSRIGSNAFYQCSQLTDVSIGKGLVSIGENAFYGCGNLQSIKIPGTLTSIGKDAFEYCYSLRRVDISDLSAWCKLEFPNPEANPLNRGSDLYLKGKKVTELTIPSDITEIHSYTFCNCYSLTSVTIPDGVTKIGEGAFSGCSRLTSFTIPNSVTEIKSYAFQSCTGELIIDNKALVEKDYTSSNYPLNSWLNYSQFTKLTFGENVTKIGSYAFRKFSSLTSVTIPDGVTSIERNAFTECTGLKSVYIPNSVTKIGFYAFSGCSSLTSITIPNSVTEIKTYVFQDSTGELIIDNKALVEKDYASNDYPMNSNTSTWLSGSKFTKLTIGDSITKIGSYAFCNFSTLTSVTIGNNVSEIGSFAFDSCRNLTSVYITDLSAWCKIDFDSYNANPLCYAKKIHLNGTEITELTIPSDITTIMNYTFYNCSSLTSVTIPDSVTSIGSNAFIACGNLSNVTIGNSVETIGYKAFNSCGNLSNVTIGNSVETIENSAFSDCKNLKEISLPNSLKSICRYAFGDCGLTTITIPENVTTIEFDAFRFCKLEQVYCKPTTPPTAVADGNGNWRAFNTSGNINAPIYVPEASLSSYRWADYWEDLNIFGYDF